MSFARIRPPMPRPRQAWSTAMRPMWPSGSRRPVAIGISGIERDSVDRLFVHLVELDRERHALLLDEHGEADRRGVRARLFPRQELDAQVVYTSREKYNSSMKSLWSDAEAAQFAGPLGPRVYTSRLLGRDRSLVLHGAATPRSSCARRTSSARKRTCST
jgi:hypothetical protein